MKTLIALIALVIPSLASAGLPEQQQVRICAAAAEEAQLEVALTELAAGEEMVVSRGDALLLMRCGDRSLLQVMLDGRQAENLEYAVIDLGVDVRAPMVAQEGGALDLTQYLLQQAVANGSEEVRQFALEYFRNFRDGEFNPNLYLLSMK